jgi:hypothetical protein
MHLSPGGQQFRDDDGSADPAVAEALARFANGEGDEHAVLVALAASRLLVPVVAVLAEASQDGAEKSSEMALPTLIGQDGRPAIIAFTCVASLARWRADARPMPAEADRVWQSAVAEQTRWPPASRRRSRTRTRTCTPPSRRPSPPHRWLKVPAWARRSRQMRTCTCSC